MAPPRSQMDRPFRMDPDQILNTVVYFQSAFRRFVVDEPRQLVGISATVPDPPVAVALWRCRRALRPELVDVEAEAMLVAPIICSRESGLTLGPLVRAYEQYSAVLPKGHPVLEMLQERFGEVVVDAEEDIMRGVLQAPWPSEGKRRIAEAKRFWGAPERPPWGGDALFPRLEGALDELRQKAEDTLTSELPHCRTTRGLHAMAEAIELELGDVNTPLKGRIRAATANYLKFLDLTAHTAFNWPPVGALRSVASAGRWYALEFGKDHPVAEDFVAAVRRQRAAQEKEAVAELEPVLRGLEEVRAKLGTDPPPPKLLAEGYREELDAQMLEAQRVLDERLEEIGAESDEVLRLAKAILLPEPFLQRMLDEADEAAAVLRRPQPPTRPGPSTEEGEERLTASVRLLQLLPQVEAHPEHATVAAALRAEFSSELEIAQPWVGLLLDRADDDEDDGWHKPPDFAVVDQPLAPPRPPPTPPKPPTPVRVATPEPEPDVTCHMRLHGVTLEEAQQNSEALLLEKLALIIAKECGVPSEWICKVSLAAPPKPPPPPVQEGTDEAAEGDGAGEAGGDGGGDAPAPGTTPEN